MGVKVSVVITTHNRVQLLKQAVASVLNQSYQNLECIVVDDASNDGTYEYMQSLYDERVISIRIPKSESHGGNYARNIGIKEASGDYIAFLDDDDFWLKTKLQKQVEKMESEEDVGLVYCGRIIYVDNEFAFEQSPDSEFCGDLGKKVFEKIFCTTSAIMVRKDILNRIGGFDENLAFWQEYDLLIRVCQITKVAYADEALIVFRNNFKDKNRLSNKYEEWKQAVQQIYGKYYSIIKDLPNNTRKRMRLVYLENASSRCYITGRKKELHAILKEIYQLNHSKVSYIKYILNLSSQQIIYLKYKLKRFDFVDVDAILNDIQGDLNP